MPKPQEAIFISINDSDEHSYFAIRRKDQVIKRLFGLPAGDFTQYIEQTVQFTKYSDTQVEIRFSDGKKIRVSFKAPPEKSASSSKKPKASMRSLPNYNNNRDGITNESLAIERKKHFPDRASDENKNVNLLLPKDSRVAIVSESADNPALMLNKLIYNHGTTQQPKIELNKQRLKKNDNTKIIEELAQRSAKLLQQLGLRQIQMTATLSTPLAIGLGSGSVYETSICLHHVYGFPYIPGSAVKGLCLAWLRQEYQNLNQDTLPKWVQSFFGIEDEKGQLTFQDAYPLEEVAIQLDIINVHYPKYYSGNDWPDDNQNPVPIHFPVVPAGQRFRFNVGWKTTANSKLAKLPEGLASKLGGQPDSLEDFIKKTISKALKDWGIGAKTAIGYGKF